MPKSLRITRSMKESVMDRRKFICGLAGNIVVLPSLVAWSREIDAASTNKAAMAPLSTLAANSARDLGSYADPDPQFTGAPIAGAKLDAQYVTDYSGLAYDAANRRILIFGGGHGASEQTNIRVFDLDSLTWSNLYPSTPASEMLNKPSNVDVRNGRWITSNQPTARHTYNGSLVRGNEFVMIANRGMPFSLGDASVNWLLYWGGRTCKYNFGTRTWTYGSLGASHENVAPPNSPWDFDSAACLDPISNRILIVGAFANSGPGTIWLYNPDDDTYVTGPTFERSVSTGSGSLVYYPPLDRFYFFNFYYTSGTPVPVDVYEITLNRAGVPGSKVSKLATSGSKPVAEYGLRNGFAYDSTNMLIGGNPTAGVFYTFDPRTSAWGATKMNVETGSTGTPQLRCFALTFDPGSGCYIFLQNDGYLGRNTTWAYRYGSSGRSVAASPNVSDLTISLDFGGGNIAVFDGASAIDKGDFVGEFVRQKSYLAINSAYPDWRVWIRVDADATGSRIAEPAAGWRDEIIVEYGRAKSGKPANRLSSYVATIKKAGNTIYTTTVPQHFWYSRWRYQSAERPVVRTPASVISRQWLPKFGTSAMYGGTGANYAITWPGPMGSPQRLNGAFDPFMGTGGDHEEIGFLTEYGATYVIFGNNNALTTTRTAGEWCGNWCMHIRDDATANMPSFRDTTTKPVSYGGSVNEAVQETAYANFVSLDYGTGADGSHWYPCANLPWLLTDDPFFLEELQFGVNHRILYGAIIRAEFNLPGMSAGPVQDRAMAWVLRDLLLLSKSTPATAPGWLQPQSYWTACLEDHRQFIMKYVNSTARLSTLFRAWPRQDVSATWENGWQSAVVGMIVQAGFTAWKPVFDWSIQKQIAMTNGTSGWNRQWPAPYLVSFLNDQAYYNSEIFGWRPWGTNTTVDAHTYASWADAWAGFKSGANPGAHLPKSIDDSAWDGHTIMTQFYDGSSYGAWQVYPLHVRTALAVAKALGTPGADDCYTYLQTEIPRAYANWGGTGTVYHGQARFSIDPIRVDTSDAETATAIATTTSTNSETTAGAATNYEGLWWNAPAGSESGWGLNLAHQGDIIFATWFTYDFSGKPWWLSMTATRVADNVYTGTLCENRGPSYTSVGFDPKQVVATSVGQGTLTFNDSENATFAYVVNGISQTKSITRQKFANPVPACSFALVPDAMALQNYQALWWAAPAGSESGWGINVTHQGDIIFATWFTYSQDGSPLWMSVTADKVGPRVYAGALCLTNGPAFGRPFDPGEVTRTAVGSVTFTFNDGNNGIFAYSVSDTVKAKASLAISSVSRAKAITRQVFRSPGTICA
jgi:hypothetical protein